jgi:hypothetical protein
MTASLGRSIAAVACWAAGAALASDGLPAGMSFIAQGVGGQWGLYRAEAGAAKRVPTALEPRHACVAASAGQAVYAASDGTVRLLRLDGSGERVLAESDAKRSYTQPCLSPDAALIYAVEMQDGKSIETEIVRLPASGGEPVRIARQPGAQHEPFIHAGRWLTYASVACSDGCDRLLVEVWLRDLIGGTARQLTLLNAISQTPVSDGKRVVFTSNVSGAYQLWQVGLDGANARRLTDGPANALSPAFCAGEVYFIAMAPGGASLMRLTADGKAVALPVPGLTSFRSLRCQT